MDAAALLDEVAAIAERLGDVGAAGRARSEASAVASHAARVVVVGEKKRGKSSLVNALLQAPALLPVDVDIATSVHISVYAADQPEARAVLEECGEVAIGLEQVAEYAALDPNTMEMAHPDVREVSVGVPSPLLGAGLVLIDTPGVGGLVSGHAALTLAALRLADALLFVVNGSSELTASECAFLAQATERVATVLFVLTQTDKYPKWRQVLARNQALITRHAPGFADAPWFPVSSRLRLDAARLAASAPERAAELEERAGFGPLTEALTRQIAGHAGDLRAANAAWAARRLLDKLIAAQQQQLRSLSGDPALKDEIAAQRARLNECRRASANWTRTMDQGFQELSRELNLLYTRGVTNLETTADYLAAEADASTATQVAHDFDAGVRALWAELETATRAGAVRIAARVAAEIGAGGVDALDADMPYPEQLEQLKLRSAREEKLPGMAGFIDRYFPSLTGLSLTSMAAHLVLGAVNPLLLLGAGGTVAATMFKTRQRKEETARARADVARHLREVLSRVRAELPNAQQDAMQAMREEIAQALSDRLRARDGELEAALAEATRNAEAAERDLAPRRAAAQVALQQLQQLVGQAAQLTGGDRGE
jgi:hypothetical protein